MFSLLLVAAVPAGPAAQSPVAAKMAAKSAWTEIATDHLRIRYGNRLMAATDGSVTFSLEITPRAGMHVYAPGADDYQIVTLTIAGQRGIRARPMSYPPSQIYHFEPLDERIPVYEKPFTLTLEAELESPGVATGKDASLKVSGRLDYQACDDKLCFPPVSVPLSWTVVR